MHRPGPSAEGVDPRQSHPEGGPNGDISVVQLLILLWVLFSRPGVPLARRARRNYTFCMHIYQVHCSLKAYKARDTAQIHCFRIPSYVFNGQEHISRVQMLMLIWMVCAFPKLYCLGACTASSMAAAHCLIGVQLIVCSQPA